MNHPTPPVFLHDRELAPLGLWTPETNRIHTDMLTPDERIALGAAKHGWLFWNDSAKAWQDKITNDAYLYPGSVYRAKPAPAPTLMSEADSFAVLISDAIAEAERAMTKFPQPNYVISKFAEEAGEVVKAAIHYAENRETAGNVRGEMKQAIAMLYRLWVEGDQVHGMKPLSAAMAMVGLKAEGV